MTTKILVIGDQTNSLLHSRILEACKHNPEVVIIYDNEDNIKGLDYDGIIIDEHTNVGTIGHPDYNQLMTMVQFDDYTRIEDRAIKTKIESKHDKPFYQKGRW